MRKPSMLIAVGFAILLVSSGCATAPAGEEIRPTVTYSSMDSTALVYSDPEALSPLDDHPLRWVAFFFHPAGQIGDYALNRPFYSLAASHPGLFGFTSEDAMLHSQRPSLTPR